MKVLIVRDILGTKWLEGYSQKEGDRNGHHEMAKIEEIRSASNQEVQKNKKK